MLYFEGSTPIVRFIGQLACYPIFDEKNGKQLTKHNV